MLILASTSPTRQQILRNAGLTLSATAPQVDERELASQNPQWQPDELAFKLAEAKAVDVSIRHPDMVVIGADQVLALGDRTFSKPRDQDQCRVQLQELRGKTHSLISAVVCARAGQIVWSCTDTAMLSMRNFSDRFLEDYLSVMGADCTTSVGGYKIEGIGVQLFETIKGDHFTILGLPLIPLLAYLRQSCEIAS